MDCRRTVLLSLGLLGAVAGCRTSPTQPNTTVFSTSPSGTPVAMGEPIDMSKVKKEAPLPRHPAPASVDVSLGNLWALEATAPMRQPLERQALREKARQAYQEALAVDPKYIPAYQALGKLYQTLDDHDHAVATYKKALAMAPQQGSLWYDLGICHKQAREWDQATACLRKAVEREPENRLYVHMLGYTLALCGRMDESLACFTRVDGESRARYNLARLLERLGKREESRQQVELSLKQNPNFPEARDLLSALAGAPKSDAVRTVAHEEDSADLDVVLIGHNVAKPAPAPEPPPTEPKKTSLLLPPPPALKLGDSAGFSTAEGPATSASGKSTPGG